MTHRPGIGAAWLGVVGVVHAEGEIIYDNAPADTSLGVVASQLDSTYPFYASAADDFVFSSLDFPGAGKVNVAPGVYFESISVSSPIVVRSADGPDSTTICGTGGTVATVGGAAVVFGFTITGGDADEGGGMVCSGNATVVDCTFANNAATTAGGGMLLVGPGPTVDDCRFESNSAGQRGGGLAITTEATVQRRLLP